MTSGFDPYYKWLGIPPQHQPPDHYRLLGLETFESDHEVIRAAAERQMAHVQSYKIGPQSDVSQSLLNEIARAKVCLLNPASKGEYDRAIRPHFSAVPPHTADALAAPRNAPTDTAGAVPHTAVPTPQIAPGRGSTPSVQVRTAYRRRKKPNIGVVVTACSLAFIFLVLAIAVFTDLPEQIGQAERTKKQPQAVGKTEPQVESLRPKQPERIREASPRKKRPQSKRPPQQNPNGKYPVPTAEQIAQAKAGIQIEGRLTPAEFLDAANGADHAWMRYALYRMTIDAAAAEKEKTPLLATRIGLQAAEKIIEQYDVDANALRAAVRARIRTKDVPIQAVAPTKPAQMAAAIVDENTGIATVKLPDRASETTVAIPALGEAASISIAAPPRSPVKLSITPANDGESWRIADRDRVYAAIARAGEQGLQMSWTKLISKEAECLRNAVLTIKTKGESSAVPVALRQSIEIEAPLVNLAKQQTTVPVEVPLWGLSPRDLRIEVVGCSGVPVEARYPDDGRAGHSKPVRVAMRNQLPRAGVQLSLRGAAPVVVRIEPILEDYDNKLYPWTKGRMKNLEGAFARRFKETQNSIRQLNVAIPNLAARLAALNKQYHPKALTASIIKGQIKEVTAALNGAKNQLAQLQAALPILDKQVKGFSELDDLMGEVHQRARVTYRVFYMVGGHEVTILHAD